MKKCLTAMSVAALVLALFAFPALAGDDDKVKGLWLEIPDLPEADSSSFVVLSGGEGEAYYERTMDDGILRVAIERLYVEDNKGDTRGPGDAGALTVRQMKLRKDMDVALDAIDVTESVEELAAIYAYPVATAVYTTGENEDLRGNQDIYIFTDEWIFRVHISLVADRVGDYDGDEMKGWFENMILVNRYPSNAGEAADTAESESDGVITFSADDADLSEAPDVIVEGDPHNLGGWHGENTVLFHVDLEKTDAYRLILVYSKQKSDGDPAKLRFTIQNEDTGSAYFTIPATGKDWSTYVERELGTFTRLEAGKTVFRLESSEPRRGRYVMNLRQMKLIPAGCTAGKVH